MSRRIDIELTSARDDGTWTWRAAGARQPKGVVDADLLYEGVKAGDVVRAEAEFEVEGITIIQVLPPKGKRSEPERLEIIGPPREHQGVTSSLVPKSERPRGRDRDRDRGERGDRPDRGRPSGDRDRGPVGDRRGPRREGEGDRGQRPGRPPREATERPDRPARERPAASGEGRPGRPAPRSSDRPSSDRPSQPPRPKEKRLSPASTHRNAVLDSLEPEQRPVAEQVLRGGLPAVRSAIQQENEKAKAEGRPEVRHEGLLAMAEELLPRLKVAEWHDRAEAAAAMADEISLRDLRAVVAGADAAARDDATRALAGTLREALEKRVEKDRQDWLDEMGRCLDEGRLVRALRVSARPPDPGSRFPTELAGRLSDAASAAMAPDIASDRWATLLEAVAGSPVRRAVKPIGLPTDATPELVQAAKQASGRVPALAAMLGIDMPPPPGPPRPIGARRRPERPGRPPRPIPPPPASAPAAEAAAPVSEVAAPPVAEAAAPVSEVAAPPVAEAAAPVSEVAAPPVAEAPAPAALEEPAPAQPAPAEPAPTEPALAEPALAEPAPAEAAQAEPAQAEPADASEPDEPSPINPPSESTRVAELPPDPAPTPVPDEPILPAESATPPATEPAP